MKINETLEVLTRLTSSDSKVQIWMVLNGKTVELEHDRRPVEAASAIAMVKVAHDTSSNFGMIPEFHLRRWEV